MVKFRVAAVLVALAFVSGCGTTSGNKSVAQKSASPAVGSPSATPSTASSTPSPAASPTPTVSGAVLVEFMDNHMIGRASTVTLYRVDGSVIASLDGHGVGDEHAIGAYLVMANDSSGAEWTVDTSGLIKSVAPAATKLLSTNTPGFPLVLDSTTAIVGCDQTATNVCTADEINLTTGAVRPLLTAPALIGQDAMSLGLSLTVLDASYDLQTVWFREVAHKSGESPSLDIAAVDRRTGQVTKHALPVALINEQDLAISRDGHWVAGHEEAGLDSNHVATRHLHLISVATGTDTDIQGTAPYLAGLRTPSIQFAPNGASVAWWGALNSGGAGRRLNVAPIGGVGKTMSLETNDLDASNLAAVFWLDATKLVAQSIPPGMTDSIDTGSGAFKQVNPGVASDLNAVMYR
jgi:hypothetical protein